MGRRRLLWSVVIAVGAVAVVIGGVTGGFAIYRNVHFGHRYTESDRSVTVDQGDVFTLTVPDRGASVGDHWTATVDDPARATEVRSALISDSLYDRIFGPAIGGGGGHRLTTFRAGESGTTTITLANCFQGCHDPDKDAESRKVTWTITVRH